ncbi:MAG: LacI family transcriptional regulator, partial [Alphaproteobacteria bacterium]|nr:LacI family transcriptional regulator [Alphaproteobacteria bacterium]
LDDARIAYEAVVDMIATNPDLVGIYAAGGGAEGLVQALRDEAAGAKIIAVCNELTATTRSALIDGTIDLVLDTPIHDIARRAVDIMARATSGERWDMVQTIQLPANLVISESI